MKHMLRMHEDDYHKTKKPRIGKRFGAEGEMMN